MTFYGFDLHIFQVSQRKKLKHHKKLMHEVINLRKSVRVSKSVRQMGLTNLGLC